MTDPLERLAALSRTSGLGGIFAIKNDVEFIWNPFNQNLQIGMGGEWWTGDIPKPGTHVFHHRKERVDDGYRPVTVRVSLEGHSLMFAVGGGFGSGATFTVGVL